MNLRLGLVFVFSTVVAAFPATIAAQSTELEQALRSLVAAQTETKAAPKEVSDVPAEFHGFWGSEELCSGSGLPPVYISWQGVGFGEGGFYEFEAGVFDGSVLLFSAPSCNESEGTCGPEATFALERKGDLLVLGVDGELNEYPKCPKNS